MSPLPTDAITTINSSLTSTAQNAFSTFLEFLPTMGVILVVGVAIGLVYSIFRQIKQNH